MPPVKALGVGLSSAIEMSEAAPVAVTSAAVPAAPSKADTVTSELASAVAAE